LEYFVSHIARGLELWFQDGYRNVPDFRVFGLRYFITQQFGEQKGQNHHIVNHCCRVFGIPFHGDWQ
jgi:hypothetical protein